MSAARGPLVILADARIRRPRELSGQPGLRFLAGEPGVVAPWIPAFAGMTHL